MFPEECENCGLETDKLDRYIRKDSTFVGWYICPACAGKLYQHAFHPRKDFTDLCIDCGKTVNHKRHC